MIFSISIVVHETYLIVDIWIVLSLMIDIFFCELSSCYIDKLAYTYLIITTTRSCSLYLSITLWLFSPPVRLTLAVETEV